MPTEEIEQSDLFTFSLDSTLVPITLPRPIDRRNFLRLIALGGIGFALSACDNVGTQSLEPTVTVPNATVEKFLTLNTVLGNSTENGKFLDKFVYTFRSYKPEELGLEINGDPRYCLMSNEEPPIPELVLELESNKTKASGKFRLMTLPCVNNIPNSYSVAFLDTGSLQLFVFQTFSDKFGDGIDFANGLTLTCHKTGEVTYHFVYEISGKEFRDIPIGSISGNT